MWAFDWVQTVHATSASSAVPFLGLQREIRSGRGLPTAFLTVSVRKVESIKAMKKPRIVTWTLREPGRNMLAQAQRMMNGMTPA